MKNTKFLTIALGVTLVLTACGKNTDNTSDTLNTSETSQNVYEGHEVSNTYETENTENTEDNTSKEEQIAKCPISTNHYDVAWDDDTIKKKDFKNVNFITVEDMMNNYQMGQEVFMNMLYIYNDSKVKSIIIGDTEIPIDIFRKAFVYDNLADSEDLYEFFSNFEYIDTVLGDPIEVNDESVKSILKETAEDYSKHDTQILTASSHYNGYEENEVEIEWNLKHYPKTEPQIMLHIDNKLKLGDGYYTKNGICAEDHIVPIFIKCTDGTLIHNALWSDGPVAVTASVIIVDYNYDERDSL